MGNAGDDFQSSLELMDEAGDALRRLNPTDPLLRFCDNALQDEGLRAEFLGIYWPADDKGDWHGQPGTLVMAYCISQYFLSLKRHIAELLFPGIGPVEYLFKDKPMTGSLSWITYLQHGVCGFLGDSVETPEHGQNMNRELALRFHLPVWLDGETAEDGMPVVIGSALQRMTSCWGAQCSWDEFSGGGFNVTITGLLGSAEKAGGDKSMVRLLGVAANDGVRDRWLIQELVAETPGVMEAHLQEEIVNHIDLRMLNGVPRAA